MAEAIRSDEKLRLPHLSKKIVSFSGAIGVRSTSRKLLSILSELDTNCDFEVFDIGELPFFVPGVAEEDIPLVVKDFRNRLLEASGAVIVTPEYVFSLPGILKNALEWTVSTTVFDAKPCGFIVAAASGEKAFESLDVILSTLQVKSSPESKLLLRGMKGKISENDEINDASIKESIIHFYHEFIRLM